MIPVAQRQGHEFSSRGMHALKKKLLKCNVKLLWIKAYLTCINVKSFVNYSRIYAVLLCLIATF